MKAWALFLILMILGLMGHDDQSCAETPASHDHGAGHHGMEMEKDPGKGERTQKYADTESTEAGGNFGLQPIHDNVIFAVFRGDRLEYRAQEGEDSLFWDVEAWLGSDYNKIYLESEGTWLMDEEEFEEVEVELYYARTITTFWDLKAGIRHDLRPEPTRTFAALGIQGLAPYWFEMEATAYISDEGDVSANIEVEYDLMLSQRLVLQPRFETNFALQEVEELHIGQGINDIELGVRLRYEMWREFAPYVGISWSRKLGETADLAEDDGEEIDVFTYVVGIRVWY